MSAQNIFSATSIAMRLSLTTAGTSGAALVETLAGSTAVKKVSTLVASNESVLEVTIKVTIARGGQETLLVAPTVMDASSSVVLLDRDTPIYLEDGDALKAYTVTTGSSVSFVCAYEEVA